MFSFFFLKGGTNFSDKLKYSLKSQGVSSLTWRSELAVKPSIQIEIWPKKFA